MQVIENMALISINATLILQVISFLLFMLLFNRVMIRPLRKVMHERNLYLEQLAQEIADTQDAYHQLVQQIEVQEAEGRETALRRQKEIESTGARSAAELVAQTRKQISTLKASARQETAAKIALARQELQTHVETIADRMIGALLGRRTAP